MKESEKGEALPVLLAADIQPQSPGQSWLIQNLWCHQAVGIVGGSPKSAKTWFGLDMAVSIASGTPCLGRFPVDNPGRALIYLAEDALPDVRTRIESLCAHRNLKIDNLDLHVISSTSFRLDLHHDRSRLQATLERLRPRMLLLDPLVRLHRLDENSSADISGLLGYLRELQRAFGLAVVLVHHSSKKYHAHPGQALRGSSDLHAWSDSAAYLARKNEQLSLIVEHRSAPSPGPFVLQLLSSPGNANTHLKVVSDPNNSNRCSPSLAETIVELLKRSDKPLYRSELRSLLRINNHRLGQALDALEKAGFAKRSSNGWVYAQPVSADTTGQIPLPC